MASQTITTKFSEGDTGYFCSNNAILKVTVQSIQISQIPVGSPPTIATTINNTCVDANNNQYVVTDTDLQTTAALVGTWLVDNYNATLPS